MALITNSVEWGGVGWQPDESKGDDDHDHDEELARHRERRDVAVPGIPNLGQGNDFEEGSEHS